MLVKIICSDSNVPEWCLIEFQGEILGELESNILGNIEVKDGSKVEMTIGQHFLEGTIVSLKKPFLITEKLKCADSEQTDSSCKSTIEVKGVARKKILFTTRPKPIGLKKK